MLKLVVLSAILGLSMAVLVSTSKPDNNCAKQCDMKSEPFCCSDKTYINFCHAECDGFATSDCAAGQCGFCQCPGDYKPYCCGEVNFFSNDCHAQCAGFDVANDCNSGDCPPDATDPKPTDPAVTDPKPTDPMPTDNGFCQCTADWKPYCCAGYQFSNPCFADCEGFDVENDSKCSMGECPPKSTQSGCGCDDNVEPFCCKGNTFTNYCQAECEGFSSNWCIAGECGSTCDEECLTDEIEYYCCYGETYQNQCWANCHGFTDTSASCEKGRCGATDKPTDEPDCYSQCDDIEAPVCCEGIEFYNLCKAKCEGFKPEHCGDCKEETKVEKTEPKPTESGCECIDDEYPICCDGITTTECKAKCEGLSLEKCTDGECSMSTESGCVCTDDWDPVCCAGKTFGNKCEAACENFYFEKGDCDAGECDSDNANSIAVFIVAAFSFFLSLWM